MLYTFASNYINYNNLNKYKNNDKISDAFVISLDKDVNRYMDTIKLLMDLNIDYIKFPGVYGLGIKHTNKLVYNKFQNLTPGEIGCALSHICLYVLASNLDPNNYTLILEDDIILQHPLTSNEFHTKLDDAISYNPDMVYLGKCFEDCKGMELIKNDIFYGSKPVCFHSYMIKNSFAKVIMQYIDSLNFIDKPIDSLVGGLLTKRKIIVFHPSLLIQDIKYESNLRDRESQIHNNTECMKIEKFDNMNDDNILIDFIKYYVGDMDSLDLLGYYSQQKTYNDPFIISLKKDMNKYINTKHILDNLGFDPVRINAVYGKTLKEARPDICNLFKNLSDAEIGCFISHLISIYIISKHPNTHSYSIIFEDDIMIKNNDNIKQKILNVMKFNGNIVYLGKCLESCLSIAPIPGTSDLYYGSRPLCLHAYMIKNSFAKDIIKYMKFQDKYDLPIDKLILNVTKHDKDIIIFHPSLFYQNINYSSNLRNKFFQQFNEMDCVHSVILKYIKIVAYITLILIIFYYVRKNIQT
jgi:GR25 family glycosyltransferase involved in LPS biosynthesis